MITELIWAIVLPALVSVALAYPAYAIVRFVVLRRHGEGLQFDAFRRFSSRVAVIVIVAGYAVIGTGILRPEVAPALSRFIMRGGLGIVLPFALLDFALATILSPKRALALRERERTPRFGR